MGKAFATWMELIRGNARVIFYFDTKDSCVAIVACINILGFSFDLSSGVECSVVANIS